jgi:hypothetical protein
MPKHYKEMMDELINKIDEKVKDLPRFQVWEKGNDKKDFRVISARDEDHVKKQLSHVKKELIIKKINEEARDLIIGNITVITITKDGKRKEIDKKDLQRWKDDGWKLAEEAPANNASSGNVDMNPTGKKRVMGKLKKRINEKDDNNNQVLKGVIKTIENLETKIDEISGIVNEEVRIEPVKEKESILEKAKVSNEELMKEFLNKGGKIQQVPEGQTSFIGNKIKPHLAKG